MKQAETGQPDPVGATRERRSAGVLDDTQAQALRIESMTGPSGDEVLWIEPHLHRRHFQLMFACGGDCIMDLDRQSQRIASPCFLSVPSGYVHGFSLSGESEGWVVTVPESLMHILCDGAERRLTEPFFSAPTVLSFEKGAACVPTFAWVMQHVEEECNGTRADTTPAIEALLRYLLVLVLRHLDHSGADSKKADRDRILFARFRRLVEEHYADNWMIAQFCGVLGVSQARLNRLCGEFGGATACEVVLNRLCLEAQRRLIYTSSPAAQIAQSLGFQDSAYFSRFFKGRVGAAPGVFREHAVNKLRRRDSTGVRRVQSH